MEIWVDEKDGYVRITDKKDQRYLRIGKVHLNGVMELGVLEAPPFNEGAKREFEAGTYGVKVYESPTYKVRKHPLPIGASAIEVVDPSGRHIAACQNEEDAQRIIAALEAVDSDD